jgi:hypothetical protein
LEKKLASCPEENETPQHMMNEVRDHWLIQACLSSVWNYNRTFLTCLSLGSAGTVPWIYSNTYDT